MAWLGFVVERRDAGKWKRLPHSPIYETRAGAEALVALYLRSYPDADLTITQLVNSKEPKARAIQIRTAGKLRKPGGSGDLL